MKVILIGGSGHIGTYLVPRYSSLQAIAESLDWLVENGRLVVT